MAKKQVKQPGAVHDRPGPAWLLISGLVASAIATAVYFIQQGHVIGTIAAPIVLLPALHGIWRGGTRKILMMLLLLASFWCLIEAPAKLTPYIQPYVHGYGSSLVSLLIAAMAVPLFFSGLFVISNIRKRFITPNNTAVKVDRTLGALAGLAEGALIVLTICWVSLFAAPQLKSALTNDQFPKTSLQRNFAEAIVKIADESQRGRFGQFVASTNVLDHVPEIRARIDAMSRQLTGQGGGSGGLSFQDIFKLVPNITGSQTESLQRTSQQVNQRMDNLKLQLPSSSR